MNALDRNKEAPEDILQLTFEHAVEVLHAREGSGGEGKGGEYNCTQTDQQQTENKKCLYQRAGPTGGLKAKLDVGCAKPLALWGAEQATLLWNRGCHFEIEPEARQRRVLDVAWAYQGSKPIRIQGQVGTTASYVANARNHACGINSVDRS